MHLWEKGNTVETVVLLSHKKPDSYINVKGTYRLYSRGEAGFRFADV